MGDSLRESPANRGAVGPFSTATAGDLYEKVTPNHAPSIVAALDGDVATPPLLDQRHPFFSSQMKIVCETSGKIDSDRVEEYIATGGYQALAKALTEMAPADVVKTVSDSGLRGRGGAGYPTGLKWATVARRRAQKYVICNADEGDPGAFMDRSVLESDPHRVLEGMAIAAYAVGASQGFVYVRGRISAGHQPPAKRHRAGQEARPARQRHLRDRRSISTWRSASAPGPSSAARKRP